jgi:hypothetical protein
MTTITNLQDLCDWLSAETPRTLNRHIYKATGCGASISLQFADGTWLHNGPTHAESAWATLAIDTPVVGFTIQTIVEGSEATVDSDTFTLPVAVADVEAWIDEMEDEASRLWDEANLDEDDDQDVVS